MDKNAIKKYAIWARNELIARVRQRAEVFGILEKDSPEANADSINGILLTKIQKRQRQSILQKIKAKGYHQVMEEIAYTWFNRFAALRFMEVNGYLPSRIRVFTDEEGSFKPQIMDEAVNMDFEGMDMEKVYSLKSENKNEELFQYLILTQCNALHGILPGMFQKIDDDTELLFPANLLRQRSEDLPGSAIYEMVAQIPEDDWLDQVQIIGWLYQYYNTALNELVYDGNLSKEKIPKHLISPATTIYTIDWIVRYMVENSLGRLWLEGHPNDTLKANWKYYLDEAEQEPEVQAKLDEMRKERASLNPEDIRCLDPCMGSGHILAYLFDVLMQIYEDYGYPVMEAVESIVTKNLYGLDIDDRAAQLAYFTVMMKARSYDRGFFRREIQPNVMAIQESNWIGGAYPYDMGDFLISKEHQDTLNYLLDAFKDAKEYGSILQLENRDYVGLLKAWEGTADATAGNFNMVLWFAAVKDAIPVLIKQAICLSQKYDVVVTNPPYLGSNRFNTKLSSYVKKYYPSEKNDLSMVMLKKSLQNFSITNGFVSFVTTSSWMTISSFSDLRLYMASNCCIDTIVDCGTELFDGKVGHNPIVAWVNRNMSLDYKMRAIRLVEYCYARRDEKVHEFFNENNHFVSRQIDFSKIPGSPIAYWVSSYVLSLFDNDKLGDVGESSKGIITGDNNRFLRLWYEVSNENTNFCTTNYKESIDSDTKWYPCRKGGKMRRWYGNNEYVINWWHNGHDILELAVDEQRNCQDYSQENKFIPSISWTSISLSVPSFRYGRYDLSESAGMSYFTTNSNIEYILAYLNSKVAFLLLSILSPTMNYTAGAIERLPIKLLDNYRSRIYDITKENISLSQIEWNSFETSWDFERHPLVRKALGRSHWGNDGSITIDYVYQFVKQDFEERFTNLKANEEELNRIFIDIYGLQDELTPEVADKDVTVARIYDNKEDIPESMKGNNYVLTKQDVIKSLISYAVGCMMGRYSLNVPGLAYAGGEWDGSKYKTFLPDKDAIIPITDDEYFGDDIVSRFVDFVKTVYGADTLEENLKFVADSLGGKGMPRDVIRNYFLTGFYADHCKIYKKRPIYWLFDSGKKNGFKCLVYLHRYEKVTLARIRTDYVHELQSRYRTAIGDLGSRMTGAGASEKVKLTKALKKFKEQAEELHAYEEKIHHLADQMIEIDLDDGVKKNYAIFQDVLAKIK